MPVSSAIVARARACDRSPRAIESRQQRYNAFFGRMPKPIRSMRQDRTSTRSTCLSGRHHRPGSPYICRQPRAALRTLHDLRTPHKSAADPRQHKKDRPAASRAAPRHQRRTQANHHCDKRARKTCPVSPIESMAGSSRSGRVKRCGLRNGIRHRRIGISQPVSVGREWRVGSKPPAIHKTCVHSGRTRSQSGREEAKDRH